jgi:hypothetical protein
MDPTHETRMPIANGIRQNMGAEKIIEILRILTRMRHLLLSYPVPDRIRHRLPDRRSTQGGDIIKHVIQHAMSQRTQFLQIMTFGIETAKIMCSQRINPLAAEKTRSLKINSLTTRTLT